MSSDTPPSKPPAQKPIRIKTLRFNTDQDIPGGQMQSSVVGRNADDAQTNKGRYDVTYEPWLRRYRIAWFEASKATPTKSVYIPEAAVKQYEEW